MFEFHTFCLSQQRLRHGEYFYLMKPLIKPCGFTSNWLTFKITPQLRTVMPKFVNFILCFENQPPFDILPHCLLPSPCLCRPSLYTAGVYVAPTWGGSPVPNFKQRDLNSSRSRGHLHIICVQVLLPSLCLKLWLSSFPKPQPLETWSSTSLSLVTDSF